MTLQIRDALASDMDAVADIYNELLDRTTFTWTEQHDSAQQRLQVLEARTARGFPTLVAVHEGRVQGFASYADFRDSISKPGYRFTVEHSVSITEHAWRGGLGQQLMLALLARAQQAGVHAMIGGIDASNTRSIAFHERLGFREVARMPETGWKHGRWCDLVLMQKFVDSPGSAR